MECTEYKFDYWKHITLKQLIGVSCNQFAERDDQFTGLYIEHCVECYTESVVEYTVPFKMIDMSTEEVRCTLKRMGLYEMEFDDMEKLPYIEWVGSDEKMKPYCEYCYEKVNEEINEN